MSNNWLLATQTMGILTWIVQIIVFETNPPANKQTNIKLTREIISQNLVHLTEEFFSFLCVELIAPV